MNQTPLHLVDFFHACVAFQKIGIFSRKLFKQWNAPLHSRGSTFFFLITYSLAVISYQHIHTIASSSTTWVYSLKFYYYLLVVIITGLLMFFFMKYISKIKNNYRKITIVKLYREGYAPPWFWSWGGGEEPSTPIIPSQEHGEYLKLCTIT